MVRPDVGVRDPGPRGRRLVEEPDPLPGTNGSYPSRPVPSQASLSEPIGFDSTGLRWYQS